MRAFVLLVIMTVAAASAAGPCTRETFDVPRLDDIAIDGKADDWGDRGFLVASMINRDRPHELGSLSPHMRLGWNAQGLLVLLTVHDNDLLEEPGAEFSSGDSVEATIAAGLGSPVAYRVQVRPGIDPKGGGLKVKVGDQRPDQPPTSPINPVVVSSATAGGYCVEMLLPFQPLHVAAATGRDVAFTIWVNDKDNDRAGRIQAMWYPHGNAASATDQFHQLRLADTPSRPVLVSGSGVYERFRRIIVSVAGPVELADKPVQLVQAGTVIATCTLSRQGDGAATTVTLPMPPPGRTMGCVDIVADSKSVGHIDMPDTNQVRMEALYETPLLFSPSVFSGNQFPSCDFEQPSLAEDMIGRYSIHTRFFDSKYNEVTTASANGRYGAVIEVHGENSFVHRRFVTICRTARPVEWQDLGLRPGPSTAKTLGISQAVLNAQQEQVANYLKWELPEGILRSPGTAPLIAWLMEMKSDGAGKVHPNPDRMEEQWWYGLKKKLGLLQPYRYLEFLPRDYAGEPQRRFPLIIFLHGSGERGFDLDAVRVHGPHKYLLEHPELPFILIEPQCPPGDWWNPYEVMDLVDEVCAKYRVDPEHIYLTGLSMGGFGTWRSLPVAKGRFAAAVPICGGGDVVDAAKSIDTPLWVFHGAKDKAVPLQRSTEMVRAIRRAGGKAKFTVYPEAGHDSWSESYRNQQLYKWLLEQRRRQPRVPRTVESNR
jgi:predicted esterase